MAKEILLRSYNPHKVITDLAENFKAKIHFEGAEHSIVLPENIGEGCISGIDFHDGLGLVTFNCTFRKDIVIRYMSDEYQPLRLIFCVENDLIHIIKADRMQYQLNNLLGSMVSGTCKNEQVFLLAANKHIYYNCIEIDRGKYYSKITGSLADLPEELMELFSDHECKKAFLYQGHYSLTIAECIQSIKLNSYKGLVRRIFIESMTLEILARQIQQYLDDLEPSRKQTVLRKRDIELVIEAKNLLLQNLIDPPTIKDLARLTGTNENKLKNGFRILYKSSVNKVLQDERLRKAQLLIAEDLHSIKEIARMVGYNHPGHFSSRFKDRFGVLPSDYLKTLVAAEGRA